MKSRILQQLHELAQGTVLPYQNILSEELDLPPQEIQERAKKAEQYILHDYSRFSVMTIDAFFQMVLKAFAKELGVSYHYDVELDTERIRRLAVERLFAELDENKSLRTWLRAYVKEKISEGRAWNITSDILRLSQELFHEDFFLMDKEQFAQWSDKEFVKDFLVKLNAFINSYEVKLQQLGTQATAIIVESGLRIDDFSRKSSGVAGLFQKLADGQVLVALTSSYHHQPLNNPEAWYTKTTKPATKQLILALYPELNAYLQRIHEWVAAKGAIYQSCLMIRQNLYMMGIFSDISQHIYEILDDEAKILLSESNKLLYEMIAANDVPFIYEKTGNHYLYFLWDEFQDTSQMQWHNLKPLLANALAEGNPCLIVGDVKQAIYRWRNSDWRILGKQLAVEFPTAITFSMQQNWRSDARIVNFNNRLYETLPGALAAHFETESSSFLALYEDAKQEHLQQEGLEKGFVHFSYLLDIEDLTDEEQILEALPFWIERLQESGVKPEDIVFLVRKNSEAVAIADYFANLEDRKEGIVYDVISEFALLLENAFVVKVLVNALYFFQTQEDYYKVFLDKLSEYLPEGKEQVKTWKDFTKSRKCCTSLEKLLQNAICTFELHKLEKEALYLMAFEQFVTDYTQTQHGNLNDFLLAWEDTKHKLSVTPSERIPAMRVMTVHKAKGLEFHTVILPFAHKNLEVYRAGEAFWQKGNSAPFDKVGSLLLPFAKLKLEQSTFANAYREEVQQRYIDELNVFYVATTRAVSNLIFIAPEKNKGVRITDLLYQIIVDSTPDNFSAECWDAEVRQWNYGTIVPSKGEPREKNSFLLQKELYYQDYTQKFPLRVALVDDAKRESVDARTPIEDGKIWHQLLEGIRYVEDVPVVVKRAYYAGSITASAQQNYTKHLQDLLGRNTIKDYYTEEYEVLNERPFWMDGATYVPDRVVCKDDEAVIIEYKFGESHASFHKQQIQKYMHFFKQKGYKKVSGFLIYGVFSEIISV